MTGWAAQARSWELGIDSSDLWDTLILTMPGRHLDQEDTFTYSIDDCADWLEYTTRLGLAWHADSLLGKEETYVQEKKNPKHLLESGCCRNKKISISEQTPLWPSSAMKHLQSIPTTAINHHYLGQGAVALIHSLKVKFTKSSKNADVTWTISFSLQCRQ